ncbi:uncharacterized protein GGS22DRAFT_174456 [Annulohypoxylon maeteangense]|uniref:uncharacterized protein n=1 Tax=Annulohypoxylon maeteangense TaxID=1927788 RepID=UPI002008D88F|nr:uncharacterized protein GGS22DRAFT_174456 [Annulohypoxylon maeteangense]KAI0880660.1 hypothetical protein GGS22DRAFT_174456 [Annulohypoxylon maeteangense]
MTDANPPTKLIVPRVAGKLSSPLVVQCTTCGAIGRGSPSCHAIFRWENNEREQLSLARAELLPIALRDVGGAEHRFESIGPVMHEKESLRVWRARFLLKAMGPRPRPQRALQTERSRSRPRFKWADNFHLVGQNLKYAVPLTGAKELRLRDVRGEWHELSFGGGATPEGRVSSWRAMVIRNVIGGFSTVFGGKGFALGEDDRVEMETALRAYVATHDAGLTLRGHLQEFQRFLVARITDAPLRLQICGPNFPDYMLSLVTSSKYPSITIQFQNLRWDGQLCRHFTRASRRQWIRKLAVSCFQQVKGEGCVVYLYYMWWSYCNVLLDAPLPRFRNEILRDKEIRLLVEKLNDFKWTINGRP